LVLLDAHVDNHGDASCRASDPSSTGKRCRSLPKVNDALATAMETSRKQTIEAMADNEERANKCHKEILAFEAKKYEDNMVLHRQSLNMKIANNAKMIEIEKEKMVATKEANEGFVHALLSINKAMAGIRENL
jgi:hypothetical protein